MTIVASLAAGQSRLHLGVTQRRRLRVAEWGSGAMGWRGEAALGPAPREACPAAPGCAPCPSSEPNDQAAGRHRNQSTGFLGLNRLGMQVCRMQH